MVAPTEAQARAIAGRIAASAKTHVYVINGNVVVSPDGKSSKVYRNISLKTLKDRGKTFLIEEHLWISHTKNSFNLNTKEFELPFSFEQDISELIMTFTASQGWMRFFIEELPWMDPGFIDGNLWPDCRLPVTCDDIVMTRKGIEQINVRQEGNTLLVPFKNELISVPEGTRWGFIYLSTQLMTHNRHKHEATHK